MDDVKLGKAAPGDGAPRRRPLVPSEKGNAAAAPGPGGRKREAVSRFKPVAPPAPAARRCTSPSPVRASAVDTTASCNRARSADRARPAASSLLKPSTAATAAAVRSASPARDAAAEARGTTPPRATNASSARSSSPSPRSESAPAPAKKIDRLVRGLPSEAAKVKVLAVADAAASERKRSPVRRNSSVGNQCENARPSECPARRVMEQHRWPAMMMINGRGSAGLASPASTAPSAAAGNAGRSVCTSALSPGHSPLRTRPSEATGKCLNPSSEMAKRAAIRRSRREDHDSDASSQTSEGSKSTCQPSRAAIYVPVLHRSSSPMSKVVSAASSSSASKACQSPSRTRPSATCRSKCASSAAQQPGAAQQQPVFNYMVDAKKGKKNASQIENVHQLRLLDNRYMQWRFVNALSEATLSFRRNSAESNIFGVWKSILTLRDALTTTRIDVRLLQQEMKLYHILTEQITYLEQWPELEEENSNTLAEATNTLKASTLRLPVTCGAQAETVAVKNAVSSAVDVMQALSSSICYLQSKVEDRTSLVSELSVTARQEKAALDECRELLSTAAKLQVQESSIRTHLMQLRDDSG
ncbi:hypothetical protein EJB05_48875, partial [Eragrostis curvula]